MNQIRLLLRAKRLAQNPPSARKAAFVLAVILIFAGIAIAEKAGWLPEWFATKPLMLIV